MSNEGISAGVLSDVDIKKYIQNKEILIHPFSIDKLTPLGYNLSFTKFIYSINDKMLLEISEENNKLFCHIKPHDTVLIISLEAVWISKSLMGTFHSKVGIVSKGFGHISTTLDPDWEGPLLFSLNNPTNQTLKLEIGEEKDGEIEYNTFVTLIMYKLATTSNLEHDNKPVRIDILKNIKDSLGNKKCEIEIKNILNKFQSIKIEKIGLSSVEEDEKFSKFKNKYDDLNKEIGKCIQQIETIRSRKNQVNKAKRIVFWVLNFMLFIALILLGIWSYIQENNSLLALLTLISAVLIFVSDKLYNGLVKS